MRVGRISRGFFAFFLGAVGAGGGCAQYRCMVRCSEPPQYMNELGSTQVAVLSVTSWEDYRAALAPKFDLLPKDALAMAVPDTRSYETAVLDAFRSQFALRLAPPSVLKAGYGAPTVPAGAPAGTPPSEPGVTASGATPPTSALAGTSPRLGSDALTSDYSKLKGDAFLQYLAATALYQETKLLERYVLDASQREGYQPFIVRLQLTNEPFGDRWPYDAYANIAFFSDSVGVEVAAPGGGGPREIFKGGDDTPSVKGLYRDYLHLRELSDSNRKRTKARSLASAVEQLIETLNETMKQCAEHWESWEKQGCSGRAAGQNDDASCQKLEAGLKQCNEVREKASLDLAKLNALLPQVRELAAETKPPVVVPLLVTDQVESALFSGRADELRQMTLVLAAAYAGLGGEVQADKVNQALQKAAGRSYHSLFTVGRLADNMLRVRMAARTVPDAAEDKNGFGYETMARTHSVTLLLLVPRDKSKKVASESLSPDEGKWSQPVHVATRYEYRHPDTGALFEAASGIQGTSKALKKKVQELILTGGYGVNEKTINENNSLTLAKLAQGNDYQQFLDTAVKIGVTADEARRMYMDLNVEKLGASFDSTVFEVPMTKDVAPTFGKGTVAYLIDNGNTTEAVIDGVHGVDPLKVSASWSAVKIIATEKDPGLTFASTGVELRGRSQLVVTFPSLLKLEVLGKGAKPAFAGIISLTHPRAEAKEPVVVSFLSAGPPAAAPTLTIRANPKVDKAQGGAAELTLTLALNRAAQELAGAITGDDELNAAIELSKVYLLTFVGVDGSVGSSAILKPVPKKANLFAVVGSGVVPVALKNVQPQFSIIISEPVNGKAVEEKKFEVISSPPSRPSGQ